MIGTTIKHYEVESQLGEGGMGVVYRARDTRLNRPVALKVLKSELVSDADRRQRFVREARAAAAITHPAIAQIGQNIASDTRRPKSLGPLPIAFSRATRLRIACSAECQSKPSTSAAVS